MRGLSFTAIVAVMVAFAGAPSAQAAGAIAAGACGAYGYAYDAARMIDARRVALANCKGAGCRVVATFRRKCAAIAIDAKKPCGPYGWAVAGRLSEAQNTALKYCYRYGAKDCVIRAFVCDGRG